MSRGAVGPCTSVVPASLLAPASTNLPPHFLRDNGTGFTCDAPGSTFKSTRQVSLLPASSGGTGFTCDAPGSTFKSTRQVRKQSEGRGGVLQMLFPAPCLVPSECRCRIQARVPLSDCRFRSALTMCCQRCARWHPRWLCSASAAGGAGRVPEQQRRAVPEQQRRALECLTATTLQ